MVEDASMAEEPGGPVITQAHYRQTPVPVEYPPLARRRGVEGRVLVQVWLDAAGEQLKREIVASSGSALLDQAALRSVAQNQFLPYTRDGVGMAARLRLPVIFSLHP
jgi:periplasmic protein TonB